jgi:pyridoxamine 5'-phosphate oxidase
MKKELQNLRENYTKGALLKEEVASNPLDQFEAWFNDYKKTKVKDANAFILATADAQGKVSSRVLLLKGIDQGGFEFYTNYQSKKGKQMAANLQVSLTFYWPELERQVRVEGAVEKLSKEESDTYFKSRPYESQIGAWVSPQSKEIKERKVLQKREKELKEKYPNKVPRPAHWGGYRVLPAMVEFWQGRPSRLHDRIVYQKKGEQWKTARLAP